MSKCKDTMGNSLEVGQWVSILPPPNTVWVGKITEVYDGGIALSIDRNQKGVTPAKVRLVMDITLSANPNMPVFPSLVRIVTPQSEETIRELLDKPQSDLSQ